MVVCTNLFKHFADISKMVLTLLFSTNFVDITKLVNDTYLTFNVNIVDTRQQNAHYPEPRHNLRLWHSLFLEMVVQRRHQEDPSALAVFPLRVFEVRHLNHHRKVFPPRTPRT